MAALPGIKDLLPDHLFDKPSTWTNLHPRPPVSASVFSSQQPLYSQDGFVALPTHRTHHARRAPLTSSYSPSSLSTSHHHQLLPRLPSWFQEQQAINDRSLALTDTCPSSFVILDSPSSRRNQNVTPTSDTYINGNNSQMRSEKMGNGGTEHRDGSGGKKHACPTCGKGFNRPSSLRIHANTHTGAKPYRCPFPGCNRSFNVSSNMRRHYRSHTNPAPPGPSIKVLPQPRSWEPQFSRTQSERVPYPPTAFPVEPELPAGTSAQQAHGDFDFERSEADVRPLGKVSNGLASEVDPRVRQYDHTGTHAVFYEYPCPPLYPGPRMAGGDYPPALPKPAFSQQQHPTFSYPYPEVESLPWDSEQEYQGSSQEHRCEPDSGSSFVPDRRAPGSRRPRSSPSDERHSHRPHYNLNIPPTPPYTNEAAFSPPAHTASIAPLPSKSTYTSNPPQKRDGETTRPTSEARQQLSPDTPTQPASQLYSSLHDPPIESRATVPNEDSTSTGPERRHADEAPVRRRHRSGLSLSDLLHPIPESHASPTTATASQEGTSTKYTHRTSGVSSPSSSSSLGIRTSTRAAAVLVDEAPNKPSSTSPNDGKAVGTTPGSAPPPPYALLALPPSSTSRRGDEDNGLNEERTPIRAESSRVKKKRRRR